MIQKLTAIHKRILLPGIVLFALAVLVSCKGSPDSSNQKEETSQEQVNPDEKEDMSLPEQLERKFPDRPSEVNGAIRFEEKKVYYYIENYRFGRLVRWANALKIICRPGEIGMDETPTTVRLSVDPQVEWNYIETVDRRLSDYGIKNVEFLVNRENK